MVRYGSIYIITNLLNNEQYIGQTINSVYRRWSAHKSAASSPRFSVAKALSMYGINNFKCEEVYVAFSKNELDKAEIEFIQNLNPIYNMTRGGAGKPDKVITDKQRLLTSKLSKERWANPEWRSKTIAAMWGNLEVRNRRISSLKKALQNPETKQKRMQASLGKKMKPFAIYKSAKAKWKSVYCKELDITFLSQKAAAEHIGSLVTSVANAIKNKGRVKNKYTLVRVV
jgi:group I intron endonuclease